MIQNYLSLPIENSLYPLKLKLQTQKLKKILKTKKVVFWGCSLALEKFLIENKIKNENITAIIDKNPEKIGSSINSYKVIHPKDLNKIKPDIIILSIKNYYNGKKIVSNELNKINVKADIVESFF